MSASVHYVVFPGPVRAVMEIARTHGYYVPASPQDVAACALLYQSGLLVWRGDDVAGTGAMVPTELTGQWLDLARKPTRKRAVSGECA